MPPISVIINVVEADACEAVTKKYPSLDKCPLDSFNHQVNSCRLFSPYVIVTAAQIY